MKSLLFCSVFMCVLLCVSASVSIDVSEMEAKLAALAPLSHCSVNSDCGNCTHHKTILGTCRWCPLDSQCHDAGSLENPCPAGYNIKNPDQCDIRPQQPFSQTLAMNALKWAAASYAEDPQFCLNNLPSNYTVVNITTFPCDFADTCQAYVAVSHVDKQIVVSFRGAGSKLTEVIEALQLLKQPNATFPNGTNGMVQEYYMRAYTAVAPALLQSVSETLQQNGNYSVFLTGHSVGGSLASMLAVSLAQENIATNPTMYSFGQPRTGNYYYSAIHDKTVSNSYRLVHGRDIMVHVPACQTVLGICVGYGNYPYHHGVEVYSDHKPDTVDTYHECFGIPHSESMKCSDGRITLLPCIDINDCIKQHQEYFGINIQKFGQGNCVA